MPTPTAPLHLAMGGLGLSKDAEQEWVRLSSAGYMSQLLARQLGTAQMNYIIGSLAATNNIAQRTDFFPGVPPREPDGNYKFPSYNLLRTFGMK